MALIAPGGHFQPLLEVSVNFKYAAVFLIVILLFVAGYLRRDRKIFFEIANDYLNFSDGQKTENIKREEVGAIKAYAAAITDRNGLTGSSLIGFRLIPKMSGEEREFNCDLATLKNILAELKNAGYPVDADAAALEKGYNDSRAEQKSWRRAIIFMLAAIGFIAILSLAFAVWYMCR
jgi:hypothetical protein